MNGASSGVLKMRLRSKACAAKLASQAAISGTLRVSFVFRNEPVQTMMAGIIQSHAPVTCSVNW